MIIVANRLPVSGGRDEKTGEWDFRMSSGGLVTALKVMSKRWSVCLMPVQRVAVAVCHACLSCRCAMGRYHLVWGVGGLVTGFKVD